MIFRYIKILLPVTSPSDRQPVSSFERVPFSSEVQIWRTDAMWAPLKVVPKLPV